jgi:hypothetical protein
MNTKTKSIFVIIGALLIGIIIGAMGSTMLRRDLFEDRIARFRTPEGFTQRLIEVIQPDPAQREAVEQIMAKHHKKMIEIRNQGHELIKSHADSLLKDLEPVLKPDQLERLKKKLMERPPRPGKPGGRFDRGRPKD